MAEDYIGYRDAGVDTQAAQDFVRRIGQHVRTTYDPRVLGSRSGFAGLYDVSFLKQYEQPVLVTSTDGVGTKLKLAQLFDIHDTIGIDLVAMCVNDLLATGARPLQFLDYIACGKLDSNRMEAIIRGVSEGCRQAGCALAGGETAEHPDTMQPDEYDLAGFVVGVAERSLMIDGEDIQPGDVLIGLPSSGIHSNGLSLVRRIFLDNNRLPESGDDQEFLRDQILLRPTAIYEPVLRALLKDQYAIRGIVNVTGGGFYENLPRVLSEDLAVEVDPTSWQAPELFRRIAERGPVQAREMFSVFNMGIGMVLVVAAGRAAGVISSVNDHLSAVPILGETGATKATTIGQVVRRSPEQEAVVIAGL